MVYIPVSAAFTAVLRVPDSASGDTMSYAIIKASDGSTFASGTPSWIGSNLWSVIFTPTVAEETYVLTITDTTLDSQVSESYKATAVSQVATAQTTATTAAELLTKVNAAISARLNGGAVLSYMIGNRNVMYMSLEALIKLRDQLMKETRVTTRTRAYGRFGVPA